VNLLDKFLVEKLRCEELNQLLDGFFSHWHQTKDSEFAHFCEHDGISIRFTRARATWHAMAPCALKPWWLFLKAKKQSQDLSTKKDDGKKTASRVDSKHAKNNTCLNNEQTDIQNKNIKNAGMAEIIEVTENA